MTVVESGTERGMFVDGAFVAGDGLEWTQVRDPATGEDVGKAPQARAAEADLAVEAAARAFAGWSQLPAATRGEILRAAAERVQEEVEPLALLLTREQGKPLREARIELTRFVHTLEHYAGLAKAIRGGYVPDLDERAHGLILRRPLGVVVAIVPWNFPTTLLANKLGPRARDRQHRGRQAGGDDAADDAPSRGAHARGRPSCRRLQRRDGQGLGARPAARPPPARAQGRVHRLDAGRAAR